MKRFNPIRRNIAPVPLPASSRIPSPLPSDGRGEGQGEVMAAPLVTSHSSLVTLKINVEKNGIELHFRTKPDAAVREEVKRAGFRWGFKSGCWYQRQTPAKLAWAEEFVQRQTNAHDHNFAVPGVTTTCYQCPKCQKQFTTPVADSGQGMCMACLMSLENKIASDKLVAAKCDLKSLEHFIGAAQRAVLLENFKGEENQFFFDKVHELAQRVATMPQTYDQDGKGNQAIASLHYFAGGQANWYITEKDKGSPDDEVAGCQAQAFGLADLFGDGGEIGYISIAEILANGGELDFYFTPKTLAEIKAGEAALESGVVTATAPDHADDTSALNTANDMKLQPLAEGEGWPKDAAATPAWRQRLKRR